MSTSILATICAERLTKILVRYSRAPQPSVVRNQSQCPVQTLNPLPRSKATGTYLKPQTQSPAKWQPMASFLRPQTEAPPQRNFATSTSSPNTSRGFQDWKQLGSTRYSAPFASIFQGPSVPTKPFRQVSCAFPADKLYRDCY